MRLLITFAGMLVVAGVPVRLSALQAGARPTVLQGADPLSPLSPLDRTVTLALERVSLKAALDALARQTGVRIAYSRRGASPWSGRGSRARPRPTAATPLSACRRGLTDCGRGCSATRLGTPRCS